MLKDFLKYQAKTTPHPLGLEINSASGSFIFDTKGKSYLDFVAGVSACTLGHQPQRVNDAIKKQLDTYSHVMVYGEYAQHPATELCKLLAENLEDSFNIFPIQEPSGTFNGFDLDSKLLNRIDYIFTKNIEVDDYRHIEKKLPNKLWPSDHLPIFISIN